jgi:hypothetical protein
VLGARAELNPEDEFRLSAILNNGVDWSWVAARAERLGVKPLLWSHLSRQKDLGRIQQEVMAGFQEAYRLQAIRSMRIAGQIRTIIGILNRNAIPVILLKGAYLSRWVYADSALRPMSDIDILVKPHQGEEAQRLLLSHGYDVMKSRAPSRFHQEVAHRRRQHLTPLLTPGRVCVEIHMDLFAKAPVQSRVIGDVWDRSVPVDLDGERAFALSPAFLVLHLAFHLYTHIAAGKAVLYWFCDLDLMIRSHGETIDWSRVNAAADALGITSFVQGVFHLMTTYWRTPVPECLADVILEEPLDFHEILFNPAPNLKGFLPDRMRLVRDIAEDYGWRKGLYYILRHLVPVRSSIVQRYQPRNRKELLLAYGTHLREKLQRACASLNAILRTSFRR